MPCLVRLGIFSSSFGLSTFTLQSKSLVLWLCLKLLPNSPTWEHPGWLSCWILGCLFPLLPVFPAASTYPPSSYFQYRICIGPVIAQNLTWFENRCSFSACRVIHVVVFTFLDLYLCPSTVPVTSYWDTLFHSLSHKIVLIKTKNL